MVVYVLLFCTLYIILHKHICAFKYYPNMCYIAVPTIPGQSCDNKGFYSILFYSTLVDVLRLYESLSEYLQFIKKVDYKIEELGKPVGKWSGCEFHRLWGC